MLLPTKSTLLCGHHCRYWPPVTPLVGLQREAAAATSVGGYRLPAGEKVWINVFAIHHDERYWPEPEVHALLHCARACNAPQMALCKCGSSF